MFLCRKNHERHIHLQGENDEITKEKTPVKKEIGCPLRLFPEGNRVTFSLISFSLVSSTKDCICNFQAVVSNTNFKKPEQALDTPNALAHRQGNTGIFHALLSCSAHQETKSTCSEGSSLRSSFCLLWFVKALNLPHGAQSSKGIGPFPAII